MAKAKTKQKKALKKKVVKSKVIRKKPAKKSIRIKAVKNDQDNVNLDHLLIDEQIEFLAEMNQVESLESRKK